LQQWLRGVQEALDPQRRQEAAAAARRRLAEKRRAGGSTPDASEGTLRTARSLSSPQSACREVGPPQLSSDTGCSTAQPSSPRSAASAASAASVAACSSQRHSGAKLRGPARPPRHSDRATEDKDTPVSPCARTLNAVLGDSLTALFWCGPLGS
jgi:hypothetical protein